MRLNALIVLFCIYLSGCHASLKNIKQQTWADRADGTKEFFEYTPYDCVFVEPDLYYVKSPSGLKVYFACQPIYKVVGIKRVPINPFTGSQLSP